MANAGQDTNGSQIENVEKGSNDRPKEDVTIVDCGEIDIQENEQPLRVEL
ncbi:9235_t:CDS:2 [Dentiscutata heterogama]|uniref:9235_t:CDS:1 n=1 Tax=Dentiscutata heterogama TaxID=1316150 RepID=A0ACA9MAQ9_9GLOM|nr:9235_t:CDS:2 [Dentiscutata heterogama]